MKLCPFYLIDGDILAFGQYDAALHAFYDRFIKPGMTCLDVGANIGDSTLDLARLVGPTGRVHAFEPAPFPLARLREHVAANGFEDRVSVHAIALSDHRGSAEFAVASETVENQGMGSLVSHDNNVVTERVTVELQPLDDFATEHALSKIDLVKLDIQGGELMFFQGGRETLQRTRPILLMEVSPAELAAINRTSRDLLAAVASLGYEAALLEADGSVGKKLSSAAVPVDFEASNVVCTPT
jgi:FkbM family methyltransferase